MMVNLSLSKQELDVLYYALKRYSHEKREIADTLQKTANITGFGDTKFVARLIKEATIADKLSNDFIKFMSDMFEH